MRRSNIGGYAKHLGVFLLTLWAPVALASRLGGTVTNMTTGKLAGNETVVLIALAQNMQEIAHVRTDAQGQYHFNVPDGSMHLVRVDHQRTSYFASVRPGVQNVDVTIYDVSPRLDKVTMESDIVRMETDSQGLHIIESYFVKNDSKPPRTQFGPQGIRIDLPPDAKVDASVAMGPGGMPVASPPVPGLAAGQYSFLFPVRPGQTRFQIEYHVPYAGSKKLQARMSLSTHNYAVVLPNTMDLKPEADTSFQSIPGDGRTRSLLAENIPPAKPLNFTIEGTGTLPRDQAQTPSTAATANTLPTTTALSPGGKAPQTLDKYKWWIISGLVFGLAVAAAFVLRSPAERKGVPSALEPDVPSLPMAVSRDFWLTALKAELFAMEQERLANQLSEEDYQVQKAAFDVMLKRVITRQSELTRSMENGTPRE